MKFLIDSSAKNVAERLLRWQGGVMGQLLTPLTRFNLLPVFPFAIDNGAYSELKLSALATLCDREVLNVDRCLFVTVPDVVGDHSKTLAYWREYQSAFNVFPCAFAVQDGFDGRVPESARCVFIGGTTQFKDAPSTLKLVGAFKKDGLHVHVGRVNSHLRFRAYRLAGADTCDGSGVSRFDETFNAVMNGVLADRGRQFLFSDGVYHDNGKEIT